jgi:paraquat-inducible protein A
MTLGGRRFLLGLAVVAAGACLALGVSLPFLRLTKPAFHAHAHSLISAVDALVRSNQLLLGGILLVFGIFLPLMKMLYLVLLATLPQPEINRAAAQLRALEWLGRWSPHDVLALGLAVAVIASQPALAQRTALGGYFFCAAVLVMGLAYAWLRSDVSAARLRSPAVRAAYASVTRGPAFAALLGLVAGLLILGITLPAVRLGTPYAGTDTPSIAGLGLALYRQGATLDAAALLTLAVLLPGLRLLYLASLVLARTLPHGIRTWVVLGAEALGRQATADTMVLALMLFYLVATGAVDASLQLGAYCFGAAALLGLVAFAWVNIAAPDAASGSTLAQRLAGLGSADPADPY